MTDNTTTDVATTSTAVEKANDLEQPLAPALVNSREIRSLQAMANAYAQMPGLSPSYKGKPEAVMAALLTAHSLDLPVNPVIVNQFYEVNGRLFPSTQIVIALAARAGVEVWFDPASDDKSATAYCRRAGQNRPPDAYTYTIAMATKAKLASKDVWQQHPEIMLRYRAASRLLRTVAADVVLGIPTGILEGDHGIDPVTREDLQNQARHIEIPDDDEVVDGELVDAPAPAAKRQRGGTIPEPDTTPCRVNGCTQTGKHTHDSSDEQQYAADDPERPY